MRALAARIALATAFAAALVACDRPARKSSDPDGIPRRVITLTPSATEVVHALGATAVLVGVDDYSTYPPEVAELPRVGSFLSPNFEQILRLAPDLVIADDIHGELQAALRDAGIPALVQPMHSLPDVRRALETIGARLGRAEAGRAAVEAIDRAVDAAGARRRTPAPRVLAVIDHDPGGLGNLIAAGTGSWLDELLAILGARNALVDAGVRYPKISPEEVLRADPDAIVDAAYGAAPDRVARDWAAAATLRAVREGRVVVLKAPYVLAPSPRVAQALAELGDALDRALGDGGPGRATTGP